MEIEVNANPSIIPLVINKPSSYVNLDAIKVPISNQASSDSLEIASSCQQVIRSKSEKPIDHANIITDGETSFQRTDTLTRPPTIPHVSSTTDLPTTEMASKLAVNGGCGTHDHAKPRTLKQLPAVFSQRDRSRSPIQKNLDGSFNIATNRTRGRGNSDKSHAALGRGNDTGAFVIERNTRLVGDTNDDQTVDEDN